MAVQPDVPPDDLKRYEKLIATQPAVEQKGAARPYTSLNGHMFSFLTPEGVLALRLPETARTAFLNKYKTQLCKQHGTVMKEYVEVPASLFARTQQIKAFFKESYDYVGSLKPKPTTRKKKATGTAKSKSTTKKTAVKKTASKKKVSKATAKKTTTKKKTTKKKTKKTATRAAPKRGR